MLPTHLIPGAIPTPPPNPSPALENPSANAGPQFKYSEIMQRLSWQDKTRIHSRHILPAQLALQMSTLAPLVQAGFWEQIYFLNPEVPLYALAALRHGKLTSQQFGTFQLFWSVCHYHNQVIGHKIRKIPLFLPTKEIHSEAFHLVQQTMQNTQLNHHSQDDQHPGLTEEEIYKFFSEMRLQPPSEQVFLHVPKVIYPQGQTNPLEQQNRAGFNIFGYCNTNPNQEAKTAYEMVPSLGMMQTFLNVKYTKDRALRLNPVFGVSTNNEDLEDVTRSTISLPFPNLTYNLNKPPARAHHFAYRELYSATFASCIPIEHRSLYNKIGKIAKSCDLDKLCRLFVKRSFEQYSRTTTNSDVTILNSIFWQTIKNCINSAKIMRMNVCLFLTKIRNELRNDPIIQANQSNIESAIKKTSPNLFWGPDIYDIAYLI